MLKLILKNLWARRRRNGWLLAELILVSIVSWVILDPVIVVTHDRNIPLGYDADKLCIISLSTLDPNAPGYDPTAQDSARMMNSYFNLVNSVKGFEGVEMVAPLMGFCFPNSSGNRNTQYCAEGDTIPENVMVIQFLPHTQFFEIYGFGPGKDKTLELLSDFEYSQHDMVLTENAAKRLFHTENAQGKRCMNINGTDTTYFNVVGTVEKFKLYSYSRPESVVFLPIVSVEIGDIPRDSRILVRLKEDVSMERFLHNLRPWMVKEMRQGNLFARTVQSYEDLIASGESSATQIYRRNLAMATFFLVNLCLGVIGTFWLQTRTRREEVGVMLSFGATPGYIIRLLMGEGVVLTIVASLTGFLLYLQYAIKEGLYRGLGVDGTENYWVADFTQHFFIVSIIILLILLAVVLIGIYIPARGISRIPPTEALHDE